MQVIPRDIERQIRRLRFAKGWESEYKTRKADESLWRVRVCFIILNAFLVYTMIQGMPAHNPMPGMAQAGSQMAMPPGGPQGPPEGFLDSQLGMATVMWTTIALSAIVFAMTFWKKFKVLSLPFATTSIILVQAASASLAPPAPGELQKYVIYQLVYIAFIVAAVRAPLLMSSLFSVASCSIATILARGSSNFSPDRPLPLLYCGAVLMVLGAYFNEVSDRRSFVYEKLVLQEQDKLTDVLDNVLPPAIAKKLVQEKGVIAEYHPSVTVLFADLVDFTPFTSSKAPGEVIGFLNELFSRFDALVEKYGVEKIKTSGDCYMVAAGVPLAKEDHLTAVADLALEMRGVAAELGAPLRIGIDSGPVVAGVIGTKRYVYDLWGETVNTASRMESTGLTGHIQVTAFVADRLSSGYEFQARGEVDVKGVGMVHTALLVKRKTISLVDESA